MSRSATVNRSVLIIAGLTAAGLVAGAVVSLVFQPWRLFQSEPSVPASLTVEMRGRDYLWWFRYPGPDGKLNTSDDIQIGNELHVPLRTKVDLLVCSDDYVYALSIADLQRRHVVVPGRNSTMTIQPTVAGTYDILPDPLCSVRLFHGQMGRIIVQSARDYQAWWEKVK